MRALIQRVERAQVEVAGSVVGSCGEGYLRCCYATGFNQLEQACDKMARFCDSLRPEA